MTPGLDRRAGGVLLHPTSLPGPHGSGDLGPAAYRFVDFLAQSGQAWWQMLPVVPPGRAFSPYEAGSAFAGSPWLVSLEGLARDGLLGRREIGDAVTTRPGRAALPRSARFRAPRLRLAFERFSRGPARRRVAFDAYRHANRRWLDDYALHHALAGAHGGVAWTRWAPSLRAREPGALAHARRTLADECRYAAFVQYLFDRQWRALRGYARARGVGLIGDVPIFVAPDSVDVWAHQGIFALAGDGRPRVVAGIPPDYFSRTGQLWGNPLYRWPRLAADGYRWWIERMRSMFARFDVVRLDHFIGFLRYWEVPAGAPTAVGGRWRTGPGAAFFETLFRRLGDVDLIAEDLGVVTPEVKALRDRFGLPGMRVLQFAFGNDPEAAHYQPHAFPRRTVVYTGTHDNDTTVGWFRDRGSRASTRSRADIGRERRATLAYLGTNGREIHWDLIRLAWLSVADTAIVPAQDLLGLGSAARMNRPGTDRGNWTWRLTETALNPRIAERLATLTSLYGRWPDPGTGRGASGS